MRLTEDVVQLLQQLQENKRLPSPTEFEAAINECTHEGLIISSPGGDLTLTQSGLTRLREIQQQLFSADQLHLNEEGKVAFVSQRNYDRFQKLQALGLSAGVPIRLRQRFPSFVIQCEETEIALEEEIAKDIFVWRQLS